MYVYKVCITGAASVGKTSTVNRWAHGWFRHDYKLTVGVQHYSRIIKLGKGKEKSTIKLVIWDMAGQDVFKELRKSFYDGATGLVLMFDIARKESFSQLPIWLREAMENIGKEVPIVLVANKSDKKSRVVRKEVVEYAKSIEAPYIFTSALNGSNVTDLFELVGKIVHEKTQALVSNDHVWTKKSRKQATKGQ